jgi:hypothetical protein
MAQIDKILYDTIAKAYASIESSLETIEDDSRTAVDAIVDVTTFNYPDEVPSVADEDAALEIENALLAPFNISYISSLKIDGTIGDLISAVQSVNNFVIRNSSFVGTSKEKLDHWINVEMVDYWSYGFGVPLVGWVNLCEKAGYDVDDWNEVVRYFLKFSGSGSPPLSVPYDVVFHPGDYSFSISLWAQFDSFDIPTLVSTLDAGAVADGGFEFSYGSTAKQLALIIYSDGGNNSDYASDTISLATGIWYHLAVVYQKFQTGDPATSYRAKFYFNGELYSSDNDSVSIDTVANTNDLTIGATKDVGSYDFHHRGDIDDIRFYNNTLLTDAQVAAIYNSGVGSKVGEDEFASIASSGWYSNIDDGSGNYATGRKISGGNWYNHNTNANINGTTTKWQIGGTPFTI